MDIKFNCSHCQQELEVSSSEAGREIECPACNGRIVIPRAPGGGSHPVNTIASSAAAKEEKHFSVPVHSTPAESLITKPLAPLEVSAKEGIKLRVKTIRRSDCVEVGKDHFDEVVTAFLTKVGEAHVVSVHPITYTHMDLGSREWITDFGVMVVYRG